MQINSDEDLMPHYKKNGEGREGRDLLQASSSLPSEWPLVVGVLFSV